MAEVLLPPWIIPEVETHEWLDEGSSVFRAAFAPGLAQRQSFGGLRLKLSRKHTVRGEEKAQLLSILKSTRGSYNVLRTKVHFALHGSGLGSELFTNNTFASGTTGWSENRAALTVADRIMRVTRDDGIGAVEFLQAVSGLTQYAPYALRSFIIDGRGSAALSIGRAMAAGAGVGTEVNDYGTSRGLGRISLVTRGTTSESQYPAVATGTSYAGDYFEIPYVSFARCALIDNGTNLLLQSDELDTTWGTTFASVNDQAITAPDGTSTADAIIEDSTAASGHYVFQGFTVASTALEYSFSCALRAGTRTRVDLRIRENTGTTDLVANFNLSTGSVETTSAGANWANARAFIGAMGSDWYYCCIVGRKTNAATALQAQIRLTDSSGNASYNGDGTSLAYAWRATIAQSSVPTRLVQTTTTASTGTSQTGSALHVKGLPASTNGILLPGDWFEINGEPKQATAALNSDAAQLGYLQFEPPLVRSPADNDPVIVLDPMGKFLVSNIKIDNEFGTQAVVTYDLESVYE